jgi:hypothetical protein
VSSAQRVYVTAPGEARGERPRRLAAASVAAHRRWFRSTKQVRGPLQSATEPKVSGSNPDGRAQPWALQSEIRAGSRRRGIGGWEPLGTRMLGGQLRLRLGDRPRRARGVVPRFRTWGSITERGAVAGVMLDLGGRPLLSRRSPIDAGVRDCLGDSPIVRGVAAQHGCCWGESSRGGSISGHARCSSGATVSGVGAKTPASMIGLNR